MCARCPASRPFYPWPAQRPAAGGGPPPDLGVPNHGKAPPVRWFWQPSDQGWSWWRGRFDRKPKFLCDGR